MACAHGVAPVVPPRGALTHRFAPTPRSLPPPLPPVTRTHLPSVTLRSRHGHVIDGESHVPPRCSLLAAAPPSAPAAAASGVRRQPLAVQPAPYAPSVLHRPHSIIR
eukprot:1346731-Rhodomonas_salina.1